MDPRVKWRRPAVEGLRNSTQATALIHQAAQTKQSTSILFYITSMVNRYSGSSKKLFNTITNG